MTEEVQIFKNGSVDLPVKEVNGQVYFDAEKAAIGLGISREVGNKIYPRWERVNKYLCPQVGKNNSTPVSKGDWITEQQFYKLAFKASNEVADKFQDWVADEVLPAIRKHGAYMTPAKIEEVLTDPDTIIQLATQLKQERESRLIAEQRVNELTPKADYCDKVLADKSLVTITQIAKDYGMSGRALNAILHDLGVIYKQGKTWLLYAKYQKTGWTHSETIMVDKKDGTQKAVLNTKWTQKGRLGLYELLKAHGILPSIEQKAVSA